MPTAAIFDLDDTLLNDSSGRLFARYLRRRRRFVRFFRLRNVIPVLSGYFFYRRNRADATHAMRQSALAARGIREEQVWKVVHDWVDEMLIDAIQPGARKRLAWHRSQGHTPVICSASSQFSVQPVAEHLGITDTVYTEWLCEDGRLTGKLRTPIVYGEGKVYWMKRWAAEHNVILADSYFYSDHISDQPLLELVAHPATVNPNSMLRKLAAERGWPVLDWRQEDVEV